MSKIAERRDKDFTLTYDQDGYFVGKDDISLCATCTTNYIDLPVGNIETITIRISTHCQYNSIGFVLHHSSYYHCTNKIHEKKLEPVYLSEVGIYFLQSFLKVVEKVTGTRNRFYITLLGYTERKC